jgi:ankyrin repeat protein
MKIKNLSLLLVLLCCLGMPSLWCAAADAGNNHCDAPKNTEQEELKKWDYITIALMIAVMNGRLKVVKFLVDHLGADVNAADKRVNTALTHAVMNGHLKVVKFLVDHLGADVNAADKRGNTALTHAVMNGHLEVVKFLVDRGADVNGRCRSTLAAYYSEIKKLSL